MIYVVATKKRQAIVLDALQGVPHHVCWTTDYKLEEGWQQARDYAGMVQNHVGALRCWRGHQDALKFFRDQTPNIDAALILEDDAWPNNVLWPAVVAAALEPMDEFEVVSLHGRGFRQEDFTRRTLSPAHLARNLLVPLAPNQVWVQGSLAYLIRRDAVDRWINDAYVGCPSDIYLANKFKFALVDPSSFNHDRRAGSLIDCRTPVD